MNRKCSCGYEKFFHDFIDRVHEALKPTRRMWQKEIKAPNTWPDTVGHIKWLVKKVKEAK